MGGALRLILLTLIGALAGPASAPDADCSMTLAPGADVAAAIAAAPRGHTICLSSGSYDRIVTTADKQDVIVRPAPRATATVAGAFLRGASGITLRRLDITPEGLIVRGSADITLDSNHVHDIRRDPSCPSLPAEGSGYGISVGILSETRSRRVTIRGNRIERIPHDGMHIGSTDGLLIARNEISEVGPERCGDHADSVQWVAGTEVTIRRNHIHHNTHGFMVDGHGDTYRGGGRFENNLIHDITGIAFNLYNVDGLALVNNTVWDTGTVAVRLRDEGNPTVMRATVRNNLFEEYSNQCGGCVTAETGNVVGGDPRFATGYELGRGSPAIDAGSPVDAPAFDRLGRPRDGHPDAGAHEAVARSRGRGAGRVSVRGHALVARGARGDDRLTAGRAGRSWQVSDAASPLRAGDGCRRVRPRVVRCRAAGVARVVLAGGAGDDRLVVTGRARARVLGGGGDDRLVARRARALLSGGPGRDVLVGGRTVRFRGGPGADRLHRP
jgi:hypothetical protein